MIIDFDKIEVQRLEHFKGGEKEMLAAMHTDERGKIMRSTLMPGASIGYHKHEGNSEIIVLLSGRGRVLMDDGVETLLPGQVHYCPMGHSHSLINDGPEPLVFIGVVPEHNLPAE